MSSALWLTPPHAGIPNALLAHEVGLPAFPGKGGKGSFVQHQISLSATSDAALRDITFLLSLARFLDFGGELPLMQFAR
jgi:hypothetical protein